MNTIKIEFATADAPNTILTVSVHPYNVHDEIEKLLAWKCRIVRISTL